MRYFSDKCERAIRATTHDGIREDIEQAAGGPLCMVLDGLAWEAQERGLVELEARLVEAFNWLTGRDE